MSLPPQFLRITPNSLRTASFSIHWMAGAVHGPGAISYLEGVVVVTSKEGGAT
jgi:hypothetical protein